MIATFVNTLKTKDGRQIYKYMLQDKTLIYSDQYHGDKTNVLTTDTGKRFFRTVQSQSEIIYPLPKK